MSIVSWYANAEDIHDDPRLHALGEEKARGSVTSVVEPVVGNASPLLKAAEVASDVAAVEGGPASCGEHKAVLLPCVSCRHAFFELAATVAP